MTDQRYQRYCSEKYQRIRARDAQLEAERQERIRGLLSSVPHVKRASQMSAPKFTQAAQRAAERKVKV